MSDDWQVVEHALLQHTEGYFAQKEDALPALARLRDDYDGKAFLRDAAEAKIRRLETRVAQLEAGLREIAESGELSQQRVREIARLLGPAALAHLEEK